MLFEYTAKDSSGKLITGELEAPVDHMVAKELMARGLVPLSIRSPQVEAEASAPANAITMKPLFQKVKPEEMIIFCRQMYALTRAGVPLIAAIGGLTESQRNPLLKDCLEAIQRDLEAGLPFSAALQAFPKVFSPLFVSMVNVGENTGRLDDAFKNLSQYLEMERDTKKQMVSAVRYPLIVMFAVFAAVMVVNVMVVPAFAKVFAQFNAELPLATRILIASSNFTLKFGPYILVALVVGVFGLVRFVQTGPGKVWWGRLQLRLPIVGSILERIVLSRFSHCFAMMLGSGVPVAGALAVVSRVLGNEYVGEAVRGMNVGIERGDGFTRTAAASGMFTPLVLQMMMVGEESGSLETMLNEVAHFYEDEVEYDLKGISDAIEPIMLVMMGCLVIVLALGVFLPMWDLGRAARGGS